MDIRYAYVYSYRGYDICKDLNTFKWVALDESGLVVCSRKKVSKIYSFIDKIFSSDYRYM